MNTLKGENVRPFTKIYTDFLDCETLTANEKILLVILMRYSYDYGPPPEDYPGLKGLAKKNRTDKEDCTGYLKSAGI